MFDVIVSNPPFQPGSDKWRELTTKHLDLLNRGASYALVCPGMNMTKKEVKNACG